MVNNGSLNGFFGGKDSSTDARITVLENNEQYYVYYAEISAAAGTITIPSEATIVLDLFTAGADAFCDTLQNGKPAEVFPLDAAGAEVDVATFSTSGAYTLTGTPASYPVALVYVLKIKAKYASNLDQAYMVEPYSIEELSQKLDKTRTNSTTTALTITLDASNYDQYDVLALASALTIANPTGTPFNGQKIIYRLKDNGTARALTFGAAFRFSSDLTAPTTTTLGKILYLGFIWNATDSKWDNLAQLNNFT